MAKDLTFVVEGRLLLAKREYAEAVRVCREGLVLAQKQRKSKQKTDVEMEARLILGQALAALGRWRELLAETEILVGATPKAAMVWRLRGQAMLSGEDFTGAEQCLLRARALDPKDHAVEHLLAELAMAKGANARSFSVHELTENAATEDRGGTLPTAPEIVGAGRKQAARAPQDGVLTTPLGPANIGHEGHEVHTEIDIEVPSDPMIRVELGGGKVTAVTRTPAPVARSNEDLHDATVPFPYLDGDESTDVLASAKLDPMVQAVLRPTGAAETTVVPPALPPPPSPPPAALADRDLYGRGTRTDMNAIGGGRRGVAAIGIVLLVLAGGGLVWRFVGKAPTVAAPTADRTAVLALAARGTAASLIAAAALLDGEPPALPSLRLRLQAEAAYWYGLEKPRPTPTLTALATANTVEGADTLDGLCLLALTNGDYAAARRYASEHEQRVADARSRYLTGLVLLAEGKPAEAATALHKVAEESKYALAFLGWARAESRLGRPTETRAAFAAAENAAPESLLVRVDAVRFEIKTAGINSEAAWLQRITPSPNAAPGEKARARLAEAELLIARQDLDGARRALLSAMSIAAPYDVNLAADVGAALASVGDLEAAEPLVRRAFDGGAPTGRLVLANILERRGRFEEALTLLAGDPSPDAKVARAEAELGLGRPTGARAELEAALQMSPGFASALLVLARIEIIEGHVDEARAKLERLATADPTGLAAALAARLWLRAGVVEKARGLIAEAVRVQPMSSDVQLAVAELAFATGDRARAKQALELSSKLALGSAATRQERATVAAAMGDLAGAADQLRTIAARAAAVEGARYRLRLGDLEKAGAELDRAATLPGTPSEFESETRARWLVLVRPPAQVAADVAALQLGNFAATAKARAQLAQSDWNGADAELRVAAPTPETKYLQTRVLVERGKSGASATLEKLLKTVDREQRPALRGEILALLGRVYFEKGAAAKAVNYLDESVSVYPGLAEAQLYLGLSLQERGDKARARLALTEATRLPPQPVEADYYLGRLLVATDGAAAAKPHLQRYLERAPKGPFAEDARLLSR